VGHSDPRTSRRQPNAPGAWDRTAAQRAARFSLERSFDHFWAEHVAAAADGSDGITTRSSLPMPTIELQNITKRIRPVTALDGVP